MLYLKPACLKDIEKEYIEIRDMPANDHSMENEWAGIGREAFDDALNVMISRSRGEGLPEGWVPETYYFLWDDDKIVGTFHLRHRLCESLANGAGHIGYRIDPEYRGRGYATEGLRLALEEARKIVPEDEIYLRVDRDNPASLRVMMKNGGYLHHEDEQKYYVRIPKRSL